MSTFQLGTFTVNRVGFGAMQLPGPGVFGPPRARTGDNSVRDLVADSMAEGGWMPYRPKNRSPIAKRRR